METNNQTPEAIIADAENKIKQLEKWIAEKPQDKQWCDSCQRMIDRYKGIIEMEVKELKA